VTVLGYMQYLDHRNGQNYPLSRQDLNGIGNSSAMQHCKKLGPGYYINVGYNSV